MSLHLADLSKFMRRANIELGTPVMGENWDCQCSKWANSEKIP